jgi:methylmalonyl-CoA mutase N-terminal domain/subunit
VQAERCLEALRGAARGNANTMPFIVDAVKAYVTVGEICQAFHDVYGGWTETSVL